jgi:hypothetical protein
MVRLKHDVTTSAPSQIQIVAILPAVIELPMFVRLPVSALSRLTLVCGVVSDSS